MTILNDQNFKKFIEEAEKPVLVDFFAEWCPPCSFLGNIIEKISKEKEMQDKLIFTKLNIDESPETARQFKVEQIPTVMLFRNKEAVADFLGFMPEEAVKEWIESGLKK
ncbi:MAG: thioredoxin [Candidatus Paceibacterota bacterium]|jgi:thioredoxin 1|nr:thioredoxin [Candidatus Paceibacterota bacterium]MDD4831080.1 thioredoxin [Candidatus Paceibacterota bacterium]MDD4875036.1 thioredoxin [Candidatus Paceibacterota bacterium]